MADQGAAQFQRPNDPEHVDLDSDDETDHADEFSFNNGSHGDVFLNDNDDHNNGDANHNEGNNNHDNVAADNGIDDQRVSGNKGAPDTQDTLDDTAVNDDQRASDDEAENTQHEYGLRNRTRTSGSRFRQTMDDLCSNTSYYPPTQLLLLHKKIHHFVMTQMPANAGILKHGRKA